MPEKNLIYIYNTLTREKGPFNPIEEGKVGMYVCGPTVYDEPHIGHARSAYIFDVIRRYLKYRGYQVEFVRNVTDVDDKIIEKAKQEYPGEDLKNAVSKVSEKYLKSYHEAMNELGLDEPNKEPKATEYIEKMQAFIKVLIEQEMAYEARGDVYFDIKKAKGYGSLSHQSLENMPALPAGREAGARIAPGEGKKDPLDFALWKKAKEGEPSWPSEWGNGRPGWHIECSVMSSDILGDEFDIHGGGLDLIFPHHENELAQSRGAGKNFARYWIHHGLLTINGQKMSKSLGNFVTVKDFLDKHKDADILKLFFLSAHYAHPIDYNDDKIEEIKKMLERIKVSLRNMKEKYSKLGNIPDVKVSRRSIDFIEENKNKFLASMDDNFNTPQALSCLFDLIKESNKVVSTAEDVDSYVTILEASNTIIWLLSIFGLQNIIHWDSLTPKQSKRFEEYKKARIGKNYELSDKIRKILKEENVIIEDTKEGSLWRKHLKANL